MTVHCMSIVDNLGVKTKGTRFLSQMFTNLGKKPGLHKISVVKWKVVGSSPAGDHG